MSRSRVARCERMLASLGAPRPMDPPQIMFIRIVREPDREIDRAQARYQDDGALIGEWRRLECECESEFRLRIQAILAPLARDRPILCILRAPSAYDDPLPDGALVVDTAAPGSHQIPLRPMRAEPIAPPVPARRVLPGERIDSTMSDAFGRFIDATTPHDRD